MQVYTGTLTTGQSITIESSDGVLRLTAKANGGTVTVTGSANFKGNASSAVTLNDGEDFLVESEAASYIDGITITAATGSADLMVGFP